MLFYLSIWKKQQCFLQGLRATTGKHKTPRLSFLLLTSVFSCASPCTGWAPASSSAATTATSCKDPRASPASESPTRWLRGVTTGPSAEVRRSRQLPTSHVGTLNPQTLRPKSQLNDIECANRIWIMPRLPHRDFHYDTFTHIIININARGSQVRFCLAYLGFR